MTKSDVRFMLDSFEMLLAKGRQTRPGKFPVGRPLSCRRSPILLDAQPVFEYNYPNPMPANPQQLLEHIREFGLGLAASQAADRAAREEALLLLREAARTPADLAARVEAEAAADPGLRCALPFEHGLASSFRCETTVRPPALLAVDGSQILPDRHEEILFGLINTGAVLLVPGSGAAPTVSSETQLLFGDQLRVGADRLISEGDLALRRDAAERSSLLKHMLAPGSIALTDGPLELWGPKDPADQKAFDRALAEYISQLREIQRRGLTLAGYVDKPGADLVVRMLEVGQADARAGQSDHGRRPLRGASDRHLFGGLLGAGCRSAVFELISSSRSRYLGDLALHFFYLNAGEESHPVIARVEIPKWVAVDSERLQILHAALLEQCQLLAARPYPYILHRAHETARISMQEKEQIKLRLLLEMRAQGLEPESASPKSSAKSVSQRRGSH